MILEATFIRLDLTAVGYQFKDATGARIGSRITTGITRDPDDAGRFFTQHVTPPMAARHVVWDDLLVEDAVVSYALPLVAAPGVPAAPISGQLNRARASAARAIAAAFATVIRIEDGPEIPAARWNRSTSAGAEMAGLLPVADVSFRLPRTVAAAYTLRPEVTRIFEGDSGFRLLRIREATGDPDLVLECVAL